MKVKIKFCATVIGGHSPSSDDIKMSGRLPFLQGCSEFSTHNPKPVKFCDSPPQVCLEGDVLFSMRAPVGKINMADQAYGIGRGLSAVRAKSNADQVFLQHALISSIGDIAKDAVGTTYEGVKLYTLKNLKIPYMSPRKQKAVGKYISEETAKIDALIEKNERLISLMLEKKTSLLEEVIFIQNKEAPQVPIKNMIKSWRGGAWGEEPNESNVNVHCIRVADFDWGNFSLKPEIATLRGLQSSLIERLKLEKGDILLEKSGGGEKTPVGRAVIFDKNDADYVSSNFISVLKTNKDVHPEYVLYCMAALYLTDKIRKHIKQNTGIQNLDQKSFLSEKVPYLNRNEQIKTSTYLKREMNSLQKAMTSLIKLNELLKEKRSALITEAVTGQLHIPD